MPIRRGGMAVLLVLGFAVCAMATDNPQVRFSCSAQIAEALGKPVLETVVGETGLRVRFQVFSSELALKRLENGFADIAGITTPVPTRLKEAGFVDIPVCRDPLAILVATETEMEGVSKGLVRQLFAGKLANWKEAGGPDLAVRVLSPCRETGAYRNFNQMVMGDSEIRYDFMCPCSTTCLEGVRHIPGAVGFIAQGAARHHPEVRLLRIDDLLPEDPGYPFQQTFRLVTRGRPEGAVRRLIDYALSDKGMEIMRKKGMTPFLAETAN